MARSRSFLQSHRLPLALALGLAAASAAQIASVGGVAWAAPSWSECAKASFDGAAEGPGDGKSFPAALGLLTTSTPIGKSLRDVAGASGIVKERALLSDNGTIGANEFGLCLETTTAAHGGAYASLVVEPQLDTGRFSIGVANTPTDDLCLPGSASDGVTAEMFRLDSEDGALSIGGVKLKSTLRKGTRYRIETTLWDVGDSGDYLELWVTNLNTGESEYVTQSLVSGFKPVRALTVTKHAGKVGEWALDDLVVLAQAK